MTRRSNPQSDARANHGAKTVGQPPELTSNKGGKTRPTPDTPEFHFSRQRNAANQRGVEWLLTFEEWFLIWRESGQFANRGRGRGKFCMARNGDAGPYSVGNVSIVPFEKNCRDAHVNVPKDRALLGLVHLGKARGWNLTSKGYQVILCEMTMGYKKTQEEAEAFYRYLVELRREYLLEKIGAAQVTKLSLRKRSREARA